MNFAIAASAFKNPVAESTSIPSCHIFLVPGRKNLAEFLTSVSNYSLGIHEYRINYDGQK